MVQNPPAGYQRVVPYIVYDDAAAGLEFLCRAFGFSERMRMDGPDGKILHAEVGYQDNVVMLTSVCKEMGHASPRDLPASSSMILCYVDDVDAHYEHAKSAGAEIQTAPEDKFYGDRMYSAVDPEGHRWFFATHFRDVPPEEMHPPQG